jgi:hypothetical protein
VTSIRENWEKRYWERDKSSETSLEKDESLLRSLWAVLSSRGQAFQAKGRQIPEATKLGESWLPLVRAGYLPNKGVSKRG